MNDLKIYNFKEKIILKCRELRSRSIETENFNNYGDDNSQK